MIKYANSVLNLVTFESFSNSGSLIIEVSVTVIILNGKLLWRSSVSVGISIRNSYVALFNLN